MNDTAGWTADREKTAYCNMLECLLRGSSRSKGWVCFHVPLERGKTRCGGSLEGPPDVGGVVTEAGFPLPGA